MYHYINGIGKIWVGTDQPPRDEFEINSLWLHPTDTKDPLWELLAFDCREGHEEWVRVGGAGGGGSDPDNFTAIVENVVSTASADANVVLDGNTFKFSFDLPKGDKGEPGQPGAPGSDGAQGIPGEDGEGVEYIFTRTETNDPTGVPPVPVDPPYDNPPTPWTDDPTGVDNVYRYEWVSKRIKVHNVWSVFSEPSIWARYSYDGADGKDGKDIEFIFARKTVESAPATPPSKQIDDYVPTPEETSDNQTWTDDATGVDSTLRFEYVAERTKVNGVWGEFSAPAMWARYSLDGPAGTPPNYTIFAFYKGNTEPRIPQSESLPPFTDNGNSWVSAPDSNGIWWMSAGNVEGATNRVTSWSVPVKATGEDGVASDYYNFKYAITNDPNTAPTVDKSNTNPGEAWTDEVPDNPKGTYLWMIIGKFSQGVLDGTWSNPIRLTGQDGSNGSSGSDGLSARILYQKTSSSSQVPTLNPGNVNPGSLWQSAAPEWSEGEAVWMIIAMLTSGGDLSGTWQGPFLMTGTPGPAGETPKLPNYNTYAYYKAENKPDKPTFTDPAEITLQGDWKPYPNSDGNWWECIGNTSGDTGLILTWGEVLQINGKDGVAASYTSFVFKQSDTKPSAPTSTSPIPTGEGWSDAPSGAGRWWMSTATISNNTAQLPWSDPVQVTGEDGADGNYTDFKYRKNNSPTVPPDINKSVSNPPNWSDTPPSIGSNEYLWMSKANKDASGNLLPNQSDHWTTPVRINGEQGTPGIDGDYIELRWSVNDSNTSAPAININSRNPSIGSTTWDTIPPEKGANQYLWMTRATVTPDDMIRGTWSDPICISGAPGPKGETGPAGAQGPAGPSGVSGVPGVSYEIRYCLGTATVPTGTQTPGKNRNPTGWTTAVPTEVSGDNIYIWFIQARIKDYDPNLGGSGELEGSWSTPARLQGINGLDGMPGSPGAKGQIVYPAGIYSADTPYQTTSEKAPYVFDSGDNNYYVLNVITPTPWIGTEQVKQTPHEDAGKGGTHSWVLMESFDAIYANIGVFGYALVGSAVFWDEWVYSQQGTDVQGDASTAFERFNPSTPMGPDAEFTPNIALNFKTGDGFLANGKIRFYADGKVLCNNIEIKDSLIQDYVNYDISSTNSSITVNSLYAQIEGDSTTNYVGEIILEYPVAKFNFTPNMRYNGAVINNSAYDIKVIYNKHDSMNTNLYYERTTLSCKGAATDTNGYASDKRVAYVLLSPGATMEYSYIPNVRRAGYWSGVVSIKNASDFRLIVDNWNSGDWNAHAEFKGADYEVANNIIAIAQVNVQPNGRMSFNGLTGKITRGGITLELSQTSDQQAAFQGVFTLSGFNLGQEYYKYMVVATGSVVPKGSSTSSPPSPFIPNVVNKTDNKFEIWMRFGDGSYIVPTSLGSSDFNLIIYDLTEALR